MRFVVTGEWQRSGLLRLILLLFLVYCALLWVTNGVLFFQRMSLDPGAVAAYYRGDPAAEFGRPARPLAALAETAHFHLFAMGILLLTLTHLALFLPLRARAKALLVVVPFGSALLEEGAGWLVRFAHPAFAWVKIAAFLLLEASLLVLILALGARLCRPGRPAGAPHPPRP